MLNRGTNPSIEAHLDKVFSDGAKEAERQMKGKLYSYKLYSSNYLNPELITSGKCNVISRWYERSIDCDIIKIKDIESGETYLANQFCYIFNEIK